MNYIYKDIAVAAPKILLPKQGTDLSKWACIACDQFTSEPKYWEDVENNVGTAPSTLRMFLPEVYLEKETPEQIDARLSAITESRSGLYPSRQKDEVQRFQKGPDARAGSRAV